MRCRSGFTLIEILVALTLLSVGVLAAAGTLLAARTTLVSAERLHVATQSAADVADSLLSVPAPSAGSKQSGWGRVSWSIDAGGLRVIAEDGSGGALLDWWIPGRPIIE
jgi:type IV pilus modification protein PilV